jgi:hypothetical protein
VAVFLVTLTVATVGRPARALDLPKLLNSPLKLDITETSVLAQRFDARTGEDFQDEGYGMWLNRLNSTLQWRKFTLGVRLDSSVYWRRPVDRGADIPPDQVRTITADDASRFRDSIYPAKVWLTYASPGVEVTVGDAYVQFGRGLTLSMRKIDELGVDTTVRGAKVQIQKDPFALTLVAGIANPTRVDEASGRALFLPHPVPNETLGPQPLFGSDRVVGAEIQAGRGLPVVLGSRFVRFTRCAPYRYDEKGRVIGGDLDTPIGSCDPNDTAIWLATLPRDVGPAITASEITLVGQSLEIPSLWGHGKVYVEGAIQHRHHDDDPNDRHADGNALYASISANGGPLTSTLELKSYRNFYPVAGSVDQTHASAFSTVRYSNPPTGELITQDAEFGNFNACVDGGRLRTDVRMNESLLAYGALAYFYSKSEVPGGSCDGAGNTIATVLSAKETHTDVWDGLSGIEWNFDNALSHLFASGGVRNDTKGTGDPYYRELHAEYAFTKHIHGPFSLELSGRHRLRWEEAQNKRAPSFVEQPWHEGENYTALKVAPKWVFSQGFEYTTQVGFPTYYFNGSVLYRFTSDANLRVLVGQQRGGLRCVSGVCRVFPPFEGARAELTLRF